MMDGVRYTSNMTKFARLHDLRDTFSDKIYVYKERNMEAKQLKIMYKQDLKEGQEVDLGHTDHLLPGLYTAHNILRNTLLPKVGDSTHICSYAIDLLIYLDCCESFNVMNFIFGMVKRNHDKLKHSCLYVKFIQRHINSPRLVEAPLS